MTYSPPTHQKLKALLFDLDGTLLDSFPAHYQAYEVTLAHFNMLLTPQIFMETYSPNWFAMYEALGIPEARWQEADAVWLAEASKHSPRLFSDARPLLEKSGDKYLLGLVTSGSKERVIRDLAATGISDHFQVIITGDDIENPKPDPEGLLMALEQLGIQPAEALFVGDAWEDCRMAKAAGMPFVGVAREFASVSGVEECTQLADLDELASFIELL